MTIQRLYSLPNCTLVLEGLSDPITGMPSGDVRPLLSTLVNVDCYLAASVKPLSGGRDFFESLVTAVSGYAQEFLSRVHSPGAQKNQPGLVQLQKVDDNRHRLIVQAKHGVQGLEVGESSSQLPIQIDLTTVQLFDLVEAVDQFLSDSQTLPDFSLPPLLPVSPPNAGSNKILAKQAVPAAVGVYSLALTAIAFFFVPVPPRRTQQPQPQYSSSAIAPTPSRSSRIHASRPPSKSSSIPNLAAAHPTAVEITNIHQLHALNRKLYDQLGQAWTRSRMPQDLVYRVGVDANGRLVGYKSVNAAAQAHIDQTPLLNWHYNSNASRTAIPEQLAQFRVVFTKNGVLQVSPWWGYGQESRGGRVSRGSRGR